MKGIERTVLWNSQVSLREKDLTRYYENGNVEYSYKYNYHYDWDVKKLIEHTGTAKEYFESGKLLFEEKFKGEGNEYVLLSKQRFNEDGLPYDGEFIEKAEAGNVLLEENYIKSNLDGVRKSYYSDGKLLEEAFFRNGIRDGKTTKYDDEGRIEKVITYSQGEEVEESEYHYHITLDDEDNARKKVHFEYYVNSKNGMRIEKENDESGRLLKEMISEGDKTTFKHYFELGGMSVDVWEGEVRTEKTYYESGELFSEEVRDKEFKTQGLLKYFYKNGKVLQESQYEKGVLNGFLKQYDQSGKLIAKYEFANGNYKSDTVYDKRAKEKFDEDVRNISDTLGFWVKSF